MNSSRDDNEITKINQIPEDFVGINLEKAKNRANSIDSTSL